MYLPRGPAEGGGETMIQAKLDRLWQTIERIVRAAHRIDRGGCEDVDLTPHQTFLLRLLESDGPMTVGELRRRSSGAQSTMSEMVGRMARAGYVQKRPDPADRRSVKVAITPNGRALLKARLAELRRRHRVVLEAMSPEDQERFLGALETIMELMDRTAANAAHGDDDDA